MEKWHPFQTTAKLLRKVPPCLTILRIIDFIIPTTNSLFNKTMAFLCLLSKMTEMYKSCTTCVFHWLWYIFTSNLEIIKCFFSGGGGGGIGAAGCMKSHFYKQYQKALLIEWNGYEACQTPDLCFCGLKGAQHSIAFLSFWSYWPIKHRINLCRHNFWTNNNVLCAVKDLPT